MHAVLYSWILATSLQCQESGKPGLKPAWTEMVKADGAFAIRYPKSASLEWLNAVSAGSASQKPNAVLRRSRILLWNNTNSSTVKQILTNASRILENSPTAVSVESIRVYRSKESLMVPTGEIVCKFHAGVSTDSALSVLKFHGLTVKTLPTEFSPQRYVADLVGDDGVKSIILAKKLSQDKRILYAEPNLLSVTPRE